MSRPKICDWIEKSEIPAAISGLFGALSVDPVDIPVTELFDIDPLGGAIVAGSINLFLLNYWCEKIEAKSKDKEKKPKDKDNSPEDAETQSSVIKFEK